jgi:predicted phage terminase large subunit-like protein
MEVMDGLRRSLGSSNFSAQYQQSPIPVEGEVIKWGWFRFFDVEPSCEPSDRIVQSWDTASKSGELNDYSACTTWLIKGDDYYLLDITRKRMIYPDLRREIERQALRFRPQSILIEDKASGTALLQDLERARIPGIGAAIAIQPESDKLTRASAQSAVIEAGRVHLPSSADWLGDLRSEVLSFPFGRHDDQIDSMTQFLNWERSRPRWATFIKVTFPT